MVDEKQGIKSSMEELDDGHLVEVMFARSEGEAAVCQSLLEGNQIPARLSRTGVVDDDRGVAILVPEQFQDHALELLAAQSQDDDAGEDDDEVDDDDDDDDDDDLDEGLDDDEDEEFEDEDEE